MSDELARLALQYIMQNQQTRVGQQGAQSGAGIGRAQTRSAYPSDDGLADMAGEYLQSVDRTMRVPLAERGPFDLSASENSGIMSLFSLPQIANAVLPLGRYEDGSVGPAVPAAIAEPFSAAYRIMGGEGSPEDALIAAGLVAGAGGVNLARRGPRTNAVGQAGGGSGGGIGEWWAKRKEAKERAARDEYLKTPEGQAETAKRTAEYDAIVSENRGMEAKLTEIGYPFRRDRDLNEYGHNAELKAIFQKATSEFADVMKQNDAYTTNVRGHGLATVTLPHPVAKTIKEAKANVAYLKDISEKLDAAAASRSKPVTGSKRGDANAIAAYLPGRTAQDVTPEQLAALAQPIANTGRTAGGLPAVGRGHVRPVDRLLAAMDRMEAEKNRLALSVPGRQGGLSHPEQMALVERYFAQGGKVPEIAGKPWGASDVDLIREIVRLQSDKELMGGATRGGGSLPQPPQASAAPLAGPGAQSALPPSAGPAASLPGPQPALPAASSAQPGAVNALSQSTLPQPGPQMPSMSIPNMTTFTIPKLDPFRLPDKTSAIIAGGGALGAMSLPDEAEAGDFDSKLAGFRSAIQEAYRTRQANKRFQSRPAEPRSVPEDGRKVQRRSADGRFRPGFMIERDGREARSVADLGRSAISRP